MRANFYCHVYIWSVNIVNLLEMDTITINKDGINGLKDSTEAVDLDLVKKYVLYKNVI